MKKKNVFLTTAVICILGMLAVSAYASSIFDLFAESGRMSIWAKDL